jgi:hypothetical protein
LLFAALLAASAPDTEPPKIEHVPVERAPRGANISVEAAIRDPSGVFYPLVFVRVLGVRSYVSYPMEDRSGDRYVADLPASILSNGSFDYFVEASDGAGNVAHLGPQQKPFRVRGLIPRPSRRASPSARSPTAPRWPLTAPPRARRRDRSSSTPAGTSSP